MTQDNAKKRSDFYLKIVSGAYVTCEKKSPDVERVVVKSDSMDGRDVVGLVFDNVHAIDSVVTALQRARFELEKKLAHHQNKPHRESGSNSNH